MTFFYLICFSIVTFAASGYGNIVCVSLTVKLAVSGQILLIDVIIGIGLGYAVENEEKYKMEEVL